MEKVLSSVVNNNRYYYHHHLQNNNEKSSIEAIAIRGSILFADVFDSKIIKEEGAV